MVATRFGTTASVAPDLLSELCPVESNFIDASGPVSRKTCPTRQRSAPSVCKHLSKPTLPDRGWGHRTRDHRRQCPWLLAAWLTQASQRDSPRRFSLELSLGFASGGRRRRDTISWQQNYCPSGGRSPPRRLRLRRSTRPLDRSLRTAQQASLRPRATPCRPSGGRSPPRRLRLRRSTRPLDRSLRTAQPASLRPRATPCRPSGGRSPPRRLRLRRSTRPLDRSLRTAQPASLRPRATLPKA